MSLYRAIPCKGVVNTPGLMSYNFNTSIDGGTPSLNSGRRLPLITWYKNPIFAAMIPVVLMLYRSCLTTSDCEVSFFLISRSTLFEVPWCALTGVFSITHRYKVAALGKREDTTTRVDKILL